MAKSATNLLIILVATFTLLHGCWGQRLQRIRFFPSNNCSPGAGTTPQFMDFTKSGNVSTLGNFRSYCVISGAWRVEFAFSNDLNDYNISQGDACLSCAIAPNQRRYGLIQRIGAEDLTQASISLFTERGFGMGERIIMGHEFTFDTTTTFLSYGFSSYSNWTWEIFYLPHFRGNYSCLYPDTGKEVTLREMSAISVGSLRLGCRNSAQPRHKSAGFLLLVIFALAIPSTAVIL